MHEVTAAPLASPHIGMGIFVKRRAVIIPEGIVVHGKVYRHKIHNHADAVLMALIHKGAQAVRRAVAGGGRKKPVFW